MHYRRMPIEVESPEELGYDTIAYNLAESSYSDRTLADFGIDGDVSAILLQYGDHKGLPELRELIARDGVDPGDVLVVPGAAPALFLVHTSLLGPGDHALVVRPNYATNVETPRAIGADVEYVDVRFEDGWALDPERIGAALRPSTKLVSVCVPHNPTGRTLTEPELHAIVGVVDAHPSARLLVDETYRELAYDAPPLPLAASLSDRAIGVSSLSKAYGLPGLRIGWLTTRDPETQTLLLAAKEQVLLAGSLLDETMAARVLERRDQMLPDMLANVRERRDAVVDWMADQQHFEWQPPQAGVVCFPRLTADRDPEAFHAAILRDHGTYVGPGHWFEQDRRHFRLGFGWPDLEQLRHGLAGLAAAALRS